MALFTLVYQSTSADPTECAEFLTVIDAANIPSAKQLAEQYMLKEEHKFVRAWNRVGAESLSGELFESYVTRTSDDFPFVIGIIQLQYIQPYKG